jgi:hypothetical protein
MNKMKLTNSKQTKNGNGIKILLLLTFGFFLNIINGQTIKLIDPTPKIPTATKFQQPNILKSPTYNYKPTTVNIYGNKNNQSRYQKQINQYEKDRKLVLQREKELKKVMTELNSERVNINYTLSSSNDKNGMDYYRKAFTKLSEMNANDFSVKETTFIIENAFFEEKQNFDDFSKIIKQTGEFLLEKMDDFGYDKKSNVAKNYILFKFFADTLQIKKKDLIHLPITYDFKDYLGRENWSNMFVTKLLRTNKGQCNSMPRLYLILAEEIGAKAFLSLSPNHSYIRFSDEVNNWYNVELTNQMFTTNSLITQSGYIKSEALLNKIYMQNLSKKELFSQLLSDLVMGYTSKFGYDEFSNTMIDKALELYPNSITANMLKSTYNTIKTQYIFQQIGVTQDNFKLKMQQYPKALEVLKIMKSQYQVIDNLGYTPMPEKAYQDWLQSLREEKNKKENIEQKKKLEFKIKKQFKN